MLEVVAVLAPYAHTVISAGVVVAVLALWAGSYFDSPGITVLGVTCGIALFIGGLWLADEGKAHNRARASRNHTTERSYGVVPFHSSAGIIVL